LVLVLIGSAICCCPPAATGSGDPLRIWPGELAGEWCGVLNNKE
jgi:hypothetical protein